MNLTRRSLHAAIFSLLILAAMVLALAPTAGIAQSAEPAETTDAATEADKPADAESADQPASEVFIPSEDISEDFAVSFPVDI